MGMRRMSVLDGGLKGKWAKKPKALNEKQVQSRFGLPTGIRLTRVFFAFAGVGGDRARPSDRSMGQLVQSSQPAHLSDPTHKG